MKVIFIKDLRNQGKKDEIKEVKDGYAQNFLITKGYAVKLTEDSKTALEQDKAKRKKLDNKLKEKANVLKEKLEKETLIFKVKTGKEDRVFGSISAKQIKEQLTEKKYKIDKNQIVLEDNLSSLGFHTITINLYKTINAKIKIQIIK